MTHKQKSVLAIGLGLVLCALLAGCGNKGPLVHPSQAPASSASVPTASDIADD